MKRILIAPISLLLVCALFAQGKQDADKLAQIRAQRMQTLLSFAPAIPALERLEGGKILTSDSLLIMKMALFIHADLIMLRNEIERNQKSLMQ